MAGVTLNEDSTPKFKKEKPKGYIDLYQYTAGFTHMMNRNSGSEMMVQSQEIKESDPNRDSLISQNDQTGMENSNEVS